MSSVVLGTSTPQEAQIQSARGCDAERLCQLELGWNLIGGKEYTHAVHKKRMGQTVDDRAQHLVEIFLRAEFATELHQRPAIVVPRSVEHMVELLLNPVLDWIKEQRRHYHRQNQARRAAARDSRLNQLRYPGDDSEVNAHDGGRCQGIHHTAFEDEVDVHQPVTEDGVAKCQRQQYQRQYGPLYQSGGNEII